MAAKETAIRNAFYNLLNEYAHIKELLLVPEISTRNKQGKIVTPDGTLKDSIRNDWGYWESKDESDDINEEIRKKFEKGYPSDNFYPEPSVSQAMKQRTTRWRYLTRIDLSYISMNIFLVINE